MLATYLGQRLLTELDFTRISKLNRGQLSEDFVEDLNSADLVVSWDIASNIVKRNSQVEILHKGSSRRKKFTLCHPADADAGQGLDSVLSPLWVGVAGSASWRHRVRVNASE